MAPADQTDFLVFVAPQSIYQYRIFSLCGDRLTIGRDADCDIAIERDDISRRHAVFARTNGIGPWHLTDLGSSNGTYVGERLLGKDEPATNSVRLADGDIIRVANAELHFHSQNPEKFKLYRSFYDDRHFDPLTNLLLRRSFDSELPPQMTAAAALGETVVMLLVELDSLRHLNDVYGTKACDDVIAKVAGFIRAALPKGTLLCRFSGPHIGAFMRGVSENDVELQLETVRQRIVDAQFRALGDDLNVTVSAGYYLSPALPGLTGEALVELTSERLRLARRAGVGRTVGDSAKRSGARGKGKPSRTRAETIEAPLDTVIVHPEATMQRHLKDLVVCSPQHLFASMLQSQRAKLVFAVGIVRRRAFVADGAGLLPQMDAALKAAVADACSRYAISVGAKEDLEEHDPEVTLIHHLPPSFMGWLHDGSAILVALRRNDEARAKALAQEVEQNFQKELRDRGLPSASLATGAPVQVTTPAATIREAEDALACSSDIVEREIELPSPIAWAARMHQASRSVDSEARELVRLHQSITRWLFVLFAAELARLSDGDESQEANAWRGNIREVIEQNVSDGDWLKLLRMMGGRLASLEEEELCFPEIVRLVYPRGKKSPLLNELEALTPIRNKISHGGSDRLIRDFCGEWSPRLRSMLDELRSLELASPVLIVDIDLQAGRRRVANYRFNRLVGASPMPVSDSLASEHLWLQKGEVYALHSESERSLPLHPLVTAQACPTCGIWELFFLGRYSGGASTYESLRDHHKFRGLEAEHRQLDTDVLGFLRG